MIMKLALALSERSDIQSRINDLSERLNRNAKVQEGEEPTEDPIVLMEEMESLLFSYTNIQQQIKGYTSSEAEDIILT